MLLVGCGSDDPPGSDGCDDACVEMGHHYGICSSIHDEVCALSWHDGVPIGAQTCTDEYASECCCLEECIPTGDFTYSDCDVCCSGRCDRPSAGATGPSECL
jgi:hypothetical protein